MRSFRPLDPGRKNWAASALEKNYEDNCDR